MYGPALPMAQMPPSCVRVYHFAHHGNRFQLHEVGDQADGAAAHHEKVGRAEAAFKLITNHEALLRDVCNPSPMHNIYQFQLTQSELKRVRARLKAVALGATVSGSRDSRPSPPGGMGGGAGRDS